MTKHSLGIVAAAAAFAAAAFATTPPPVVAIVTDLAGHVESRPRDAAAKPTAILDELAAGTRLVLAGDARAILVWLESGDELELRGPAAAVVTATGALSESGEPPTKRSVFGEGDVKIRPRGLVQASVLMRASKSEVELVSPVATKLLDRRPTFEWKPIKDLASARIEVSDDSLESVAAAAVEGDSYQLPKETSLEPGVSYTWEIDGRTRAGVHVSGWAAFAIASDDERKQIEKHRPGKNASFAERVTFALLLESLELFDDARESWRALAAERPDDAAIAARVAK